jgi:transcriptional regulator with XRE-family HTH domain
MSWIKDLIEKECGASSEFKEIYEEEAALLALVRARNAAELSQRQVAETLHVSQPYIAAVETGSKPMSLKLMVRYANAVGVTIEVKPRLNYVREKRPPEPSE